MPTVIRTVLWIWAAIAQLWLVSHYAIAPWWVIWGAGIGAGSALLLVIKGLREPKPERKAHPTTPR